MDKLESDEELDETIQSLENTLYFFKTYKKLDAERRKDIRIYLHGLLHLDEYRRKDERDETLQNRHYRR